ncbi:hypothetical protein ACC761_36420 [Rhizobium ruizarguesonis]
MDKVISLLATKFDGTVSSAGVTFVFGLIALVIGALTNASLNRRRDNRLRAEEAKAVSAALYGEILLMRQSVQIAAKVVVDVAAVPASERANEFNEHTLELATLRDPRLYPALASKLGLLQPDIVLAITKFHADYEAVREWLPKLIEKRERGYNYHYLFVLRPAKNAVFDIKPALRKIEMSLNIAYAAEDPDMGVVLKTIDRLEAARRTAKDGDPAASQ